MQPRRSSIAAPVVKLQGSRRNSIATPWPSRRGRRRSTGEAPLQRHGRPVTVVIVAPAKLRCNAMAGPPWSSSQARSTGEAPLQRRSCKRHGRRGRRCSVGDAPTQHRRAHAILWRALQQRRRTRRSRSRRSATPSAAGPRANATGRRLLGYCMSLVFWGLQCRPWLLRRDQREDCERRRRRLETKGIDKVARVRNRTCGCR